MRTSPAKKNFSAEPMEEESSQAWRALVNAPQVMLWITDENHLGVYLNPALLKYVGVPLRKLAGLKWLKRVHPEDRERMQRFQQQCRARFINFRIEYRVRVASGKFRWVLDTGVPRFDLKGRFIGYLGSVIDIHDQKVLEENLKRKQQKLEKQILDISDRERERLGRDLHDGLGQNLFAIGLRAGRLARRLDARPGKETREARKIEHDLVKSQKQIREISGMLFPLSLARQGLFAALQDLASTVWETSGVSVQIQTGARGTWISPEKLVHLYRIIQEAVANGIRHGNASRIRVSLKMKGGENELTISDNGKGFQKSDRPSGGMGLATMEYRARMMGGRISVQGSSKGGTAVICRFPGRNAPKKPQNGKSKAKNLRRR